MEKLPQTHLQMKMVQYYLTGDPAPKFMYKVFQKIF